MGYKDIDYRMGQVKDQIRNGRAPLAVALSDADIARLKRDTKSYVEYILGSFPYADGQLTYRFDERYLYFGEEYLTAKGRDRCRTGDMRSLVYADLLRETEPDPSEVVFLHLWGCCGQTATSTPAAHVKSERWIDVGAGQELRDATWSYSCVAGGTPGSFGIAGATNYVAAHEMGHNLSGAGDCYGCETPGNPVDCAYCTQDAAGFWVNRWDPRPTGGPPDTGRYFMDYVCPGCRYWIRLAPLKTDGGVDYGDGYRNTISWLAPGYDPSALVVSGEMQQGGPAQFEPLVILQNTELDLAPGQGGDYAFVLLDEGGKELSRTGFTPSFQLSGR
jgi:hypothetical protein